MIPETHKKLPEKTPGKFEMPYYKASNNTLPGTYLTTFTPLIRLEITEYLN